MPLLLQKQNFAQKAAATLAAALILASPAIAAETTGADAKKKMCANNPTAKAS